MSASLISGIRFISKDKRKIVDNSQQSEVSKKRTKTKPSKVTTNINKDVFSTNLSMEEACADAVSEDDVHIVQPEQQYGKFLSTVQLDSNIDEEKDFYTPEVVARSNDTVAALLRSQLLEKRRNQQNVQQSRSTGNELDRAGSPIRLSQSSRNNFLENERVYVDKKFCLEVKYSENDQEDGAGKDIGKAPSKGKKKNEKVHLKDKTHEREADFVSRCNRCIGNHQFREKVRFIIYTGDHFVLRLKPGTMRLYESLL